MSQASQHAELLNALQDMQHTLTYALRRDTLAAAEQLIVRQESEIRRLQEKVLALEIEVEHEAEMKRIERIKDSSLES